jgi:uncharacterized membrane-anchored protein YjiN (DUF445 family)
VVRRQRRLALAVLIAAVVIAVAAYPLRHTWWGGLVLAMAEAGVVGGLADWFAVTALFRRPLGLPIPHTALIPANWQLLAARVGAMVGDRVLTTAYLTREVQGLDVAALLERGARALTREDIAVLARRVAVWTAEELPPAAAEELVVHVRRFLAGQPVVPALAWALETARREGWDARVVAVLARGLADSLDRPEVRQAVDTLIAELLAAYRARASGYPRFFLTLADLLGIVNRARIVAALRAGLTTVADDPEHPLRRRVLEALGELPARLRRDTGLAARIESVKAELLTSAAIETLLRDAAAVVHRAVVADLRAPYSVVAAWAAERLWEAREAVIRDEPLRRELDGWLKRRAIALVERHHGEIATLIENGVHALGPAGAVRLIEEHAGDDLQYIRVNGTVVGGLAGGLIYAVHLLLR